MTRLHKPVAGSRAYWPKKRAARIIAPMTSFADTKGLQAFAAYKVGMTQVSYVDAHKGSPTFGKEVYAPVTVLAAPNIVVAGIKAYRKTFQGLEGVATVWAENLNKELARAMSIPQQRPQDFKAFETAGLIFRLVVHTKPSEAFEKKTPDIFEVPVESLAIAKEKLGKEIKASDVFKEGELIDARAITKGKGFQGAVFRFGIKIRTRKATKKRRHLGSMSSRHPNRARPGLIAMAGQLGFQTRTEYNKQILKIGEGKFTPPGGWVNFGELDGTYILLKGSVPGSKRRLIMLRKGIRAHPLEKSEVKNVLLLNQQ